MLVYTNRCPDLCSGGGLFFFFFFPPFSSKPLFCFLPKLVKLGMRAEVLRGKSIHLDCKDRRFDRIGGIFHETGIREKGYSRLKGQAFVGSPSRGL